MTEAMNMVRETLGEDAVIVATREERNAVGGLMVHLTAAIDKDVFADDESTSTEQQETASDDWLYEDDSAEATIIEDITEAMLRHGVPDSVLDQIVSCACVMDHDEPRPALLSSIETLFQFKSLPKSTENKPIVMVGPPGSGKTLAVAKLAARSAMDGLNICVITTDAERAGGREQLKAFTDLIGVDLEVAKTPTALKEKLLATKGCDQVIIDTAGTNPFDRESIKSLAGFVEAAAAQSILVLPANMQADEAGETAEIFASLGANRLLCTRIDVARRMGAILTAAHQAGLALTEMSATAKVADGLSQCSPKRLTQLLMPTAERGTIQASTNSVASG